MDALWGILLMEEEQVKDFWGMHPCMTMLSKNKPEVSNMVTITEESKNSVNKWLKGDPYYELSNRTSEKICH